MLRDFTMKTVGNVGRGIILGKAAARSCVPSLRVDGRAYVYTRARIYRGVTGSDHDTDVPLPSSCATTMFMFWHSAE